MTDLRKAAEMALEALEVATTPLASDRQEVLKAQQALRQALAQPEPPFKLSDAGADTNIPLWGLEPKGSGLVTLNQPEQESIKLLSLVADDCVQKIKELS